MSMGLRAELTLGRDEMGGGKEGRGGGEMDGWGW